MSKLKISAIIIGLILIVAASTSAVWYFVIEKSQAESIAALETTIQSLKNDVQYAENESYSNCRRMMQIDARINKINGCMEIVDKLCYTKTKNPTYCTSSLRIMCEGLE